MQTLDDVDRRIIECLVKDSRASFREIAKETGSSTDTIMRRFHRLIKSQVIQPTIKVNLVKLGYEAIMLYGVKVSSQNVLRQITEKVARIPDVTAVMETTGEYDLMVHAVVRNIEHIFKIADDILNTVGIRKVAIAEIQSKAATFPPKPWHNLDIRTE